MIRAVAILCLMSLTACTPPASQIVRTEYVRRQTPPKPEAPDYFPVQWGGEKGRYCVDEEGAKNMLKNRELDKAYQAEVDSAFNELNAGGVRK